MTAEDKKEFDEKAKEDQARYAAELAEYKKSNPAPSSSPKAKKKKKTKSDLLAGQQKLNVKVRMAGESSGRGL